MIRTPPDFFFTAISAISVDFPEPQAVGTTWKPGVSGRVAEQVRNCIVTRPAESTDIPILP